MISYRYFGKPMKIGKTVLKFNDIISEKEFKEILKESIITPRQFRKIEIKTKNNTINKTIEKENDLEPKTIEKEDNLEPKKIKNYRLNKKLKRKTN